MTTHASDERYHYADTRASINSNHTRIANDSVFKFVPAIGGKLVIAAGSLSTTVHIADILNGRTEHLPNKTLSDINTRKSKTSMRNYATLLTPEGKMYNLNVDSREDLVTRTHTRTVGSSSLRSLGSGSDYVKTYRARYPKSTVLECIHYASKMDPCTSSTIVRFPHVYDPNNFVFDIIDLRSMRIRKAKMKLPITKEEIDDWYEENGDMSTIDPITNPLITYIGRPKKFVHE